MAGGERGYLYAATPRGETDWVYDASNLFRRCLYVRRADEFSEWPRARSLEEDPEGRLGERSARP